MSTTDTRYGHAPNETCSDPRYGHVPSEAALTAAVDSRPLPTWKATEDHLPVRADESDTLELGPHATALVIRHDRYGYRAFLYVATPTTDQPISRAEAIRFAIERAEAIAEVLRRLEAESNGR